MKLKAIVWGCVIGAVIGLALLAAGVTAAPETPPHNPTCETAVIDGRINEWADHLKRDHFTVIYEAGKPGHDQIGDVYIRHDGKTAYVLILLRDGYTLDKKAGEQWIKLWNDWTPVYIAVDGNDAPDRFAYIGDRGWEASFKMPTNTNIVIDIHALYGNNQTARPIHDGITIRSVCEATAIGGVDLAAISRGIDWPIVIALGVTVSLAFITAFVTCVNAHKR